MEEMMKLYHVMIAVVPLLTLGTACGHKLDDGSGLAAAHVTLVSASARGWLGVSLDDVTPRLARKKALSVEEGAYVTGVEDGSPADDAGIRTGDVIVEFDGKTITDADELIEAVRRTKPGTEVSITVMRGNERKTLTATIERRREPRVFSFRMPPLPRFDVWPDFEVRRMATVRGMRVETLTKQLGEYFGAPKGRGVLVRSVRRDSDADKAGFTAGDVITKIEDDAVADVDDLLDALRRYRKRDSVAVEIIRRGTKQILSWSLKGTDDDISRDEGDHDFFFDFLPPEYFSDPRVEMDRRLQEELDRQWKNINDQMWKLNNKLDESSRQLRTT
jgi:membrane-associated protease RseP (regulator of RpoE activity)